MYLANKKLCFKFKAGVDICLNENQVFGYCSLKLRRSIDDMYWYDFSFHNKNPDYLKINGIFFNLNVSLTFPINFDGISHAILKSLRGHCNFILSSLVKKKCFFEYFFQEVCFRISLLQVIFYESRTKNLSISCLRILLWQFHGKEIKKAFFLNMFVTTDDISWEQNKRLFSISYLKYKFDNSKSFIEHFFLHSYNGVA